MSDTTRTIGLFGVPSSAASYAAGQDQAPRVLREAGLITALESAGVTVVETPDLTEQVWTPDATSPLAQNVDDVVASSREVTDRVAGEISAGRRVVVIGGNCTVAPAAVAGVRQATGVACALIYSDRHLDMNTPTTTREGALDWMGLGHALDLPGAVSDYAAAFGSRPLLGPGQVVFLGVDPTQSTASERDHVERLAFPVVSQTEVIADPAGAARAALAALPDDIRQFVVHIDVDVLDFTETPLAENTSGRNVGPTLDQLTSAVATVVADSRWRVLTVGEVNPTRAAGDPSVLTRFVTALAQIVGASTPDAGDA
ncbi:arginase family protein [Williamsia deligens]|uniref:Arginase family protein n=1 Tax=Williamsia deligens TaxID=321325 RepID=A0ABW3G782_9NOCA|nr:arginase family protein [Williamsia deligens]